MNCYKARRFSSAYWDDEITQAEREWLEAHFAACPKCRSEYESFARVIEGVASLPRLDVADDFVERTVARARRAAPVADRLPDPRPAWAPVAVAASMLLVTVTLLVPRLALLGPAGGGQANRLAPQEARLVTSQLPVASVPAAIAPSTGAATTSRPATQEQVAALIDSLIDHGQDVDFVIDPVRVGHERTAGRRPEPVQGHRAVITF